MKNKLNYKGFGKIDSFKLIHKERKGYLKYDSVEATEKVIIIY